MFFDIQFIQEAFKDEFFGFDKDFQTKFYTFYRLPSADKKPYLSEIQQLFIKNNIEIEQLVKLPMSPHIQLCWRLAECFCTTGTSKDYYQFFFPQVEEKESITTERFFVVEDIPYFKVTISRQNFLDPWLYFPIDLIVDIYKYAHIVGSQNWLYSENEIAEKLKIQKCSPSRRQVFYQAMAINYLAIGNYIHLPTLAKMIGDEIFIQLIEVTIPYTRSYYEDEKSIKKQPIQESTPPSSSKKVRQNDEEKWIPIIDELIENIEKRYDGFWGKGDTSKIAVLQSIKGKIPQGIYVSQKMIKNSIEHACSLRRHSWSFWQADSLNEFHDLVTAKNMTF